jgi:hypothetical protein
MKRVIVYCGFGLGTLIVVLTFLTATSYLQLAIAVFLYFTLAIFAFRAFPRKVAEIHKEEPLAPALTPAMPTASANIEADKPEREEVGIVDIDKRAFLKLIGGVGISLFLFSIFNKRAEGLLFKSAPATGAVSLEDSTGKTIDPAERQPMDGYKISEIDDNTITFYGFTDKNANWIIMREDTDTGSFRYSRGNSNFPGNWNSRERLSYDYFHNVFRS